MNIHPSQVVCLATGGKNLTVQQRHKLTLCLSSLKKKINIVKITKANSILNGILIHLKKIQKIICSLGILNLILKN